MTTTENILALLNKAVAVGSSALKFGQDAAPIAQLIFDTFVKGGAFGAGSVIPVLGSAFQIGSVLIEAGRDLAPVAIMLYDTFVNKKVMTQDELDAFAAETDRIGALLMAPLPDPEPGETA